MEIIWHGQSCFTIKGKNATIVLDPYHEEIGLKLPQLKADIVLVSHDHFDHNNVEAVEGEYKLFNSPGEYERLGVTILGIEAFHYSKNDEEEAKKRGKITIFALDVDGFKICHLGDLGHKLTSDLLEAIGDVDILMVPVGGKFTIDAEKAVEVVEQIEPRVIIPMHYKIPGNTTEIDTNEKFLKEVGVAGAVEIDKFSVKAVTDLPDDKTDYVVLKPITK